MGYNLLKSLCIKVGDSIQSFDFTKLSCYVLVDKDSKNLYSVSFTLKDSLKVLDLDTLEKEKMANFLNTTSNNCGINIDYMLNNSQKYNIRENGISPFEAFNNVIRFGNNITRLSDKVISCCDILYIFQVDNFSLELSKELYSVPINKTEIAWKSVYQGEQICDFGISTNRDIERQYSVIDIALALINGRNVIYPDGKSYKNSRLYKIVITDRGRALITKYRMAKGL